MVNQTQLIIDLMVELRLPKVFEFLYLICPVKNYLKNLMKCISKEITSSLANFSKNLELFSNARNGSLGLTFFTEQKWAHQNFCGSKGLDYFGLWSKSFTELIRTSH